ncbi:MAG: DUF6500 family protein [Morganella sp. (in: enterobacteria)]
MLPVYLPLPPACILNDVGYELFFTNKNDDPDSLMEAATWWIMTHKLDHFEKAHKIKALVLSED